MPSNGIDRPSILLPHVLHHTATGTVVGVSIGLTRAERLHARAIDRYYRYKCTQVRQHLPFFRFCVIIVPVA